MKKMLEYSRVFPKPVKSMPPEPQLSDSALITFGQIARELEKKRYTDISLYRKKMSSHSQHTHTVFVKAFSKKFAKQFFNPMDAQELQNPEIFSAIQV